MGTDGKAAAAERSRKWKTRLAMLIVLFLGTIFICVNFGFTSIPIQDTTIILLKNTPGIGSLIQLTPAQLSVQATVIDVRLPRVLCGVLVGAALAAAGTVYQGMFRNPMADPFVISASQGAALGAALAIVIGLGASLLRTNAIAVFAFVGCIGSVLLVYLISRVGHRVPITTLLLSGIAVGLFELAIITYLQSIAGEKLGPLVFWIIGSLSSSRVTWVGLLGILPFILIGLVISYAYSRDLNLLSLGEDQAQHLGINVERVKLILLLFRCFHDCCRCIHKRINRLHRVDDSHMTRLLVGPDHRVLLPASVLLGATFLVWCDGIVRLLSSPSSPGEVPVGVITVMSGVVFFLFLLRRKKRVDAF